jgi:hypothetical protein
MNTANLQMEGVLLVLTSLVAAMKRKGLLNDDDCDAALSDAESMAFGRDSLSEANREAILFPIRFLKAASHMRDGGQISYSDLTAAVGRE